MPGSLKFYAPPPIRKMEKPEYTVFRLGSQKWTYRNRKGAQRSAERRKNPPGTGLPFPGGRQRACKDAGIHLPLRGHVFTEEHMGMLIDNELTASCLAGGLGGTRERLDKTLRRLFRDSPLDAQGEEPAWPRHLAAGCRDPHAAAVTQALRDLTDYWQGFMPRPDRFRETERLFGVLKDRILTDLDHGPALWLEYHRLAQSLNELALDSSSQENPELPF
jgi:hypothetical protein